MRELRNHETQTCTKWSRRLPFPVGLRTMRVGLHYDKSAVLIRSENWDLEALKRDKHFPTSNIWRTVRRMYCIVDNRIVPLCAWVLVEHARGQDELRDWFEKYVICILQRSINSQLLLN